MFVDFLITASSDKYKLICSVLTPAVCGFPSVYLGAASLRKTFFRRFKHFHVNCFFLLLYHSAFSVHHQVRVVRLTLQVMLGRLSLTFCLKQIFFMLTVPLRCTHRIYQYSHKKQRILMNVFLCRELLKKASDSFYTEFKSQCSRL